MPPKAKPPGGATTPRQFRLTDAELETIDRIGRKLSNDPAVVVSRTDVIRAGIRMMAAKWLKIPNTKG